MRADRELGDPTPPIGYRAAASSTNPPLSQTGGAAAAAMRQPRPGSFMRWLGGKGSDYAFSQVLGLLALLGVAHEVATNHP